jgi:hypothetical protein
VKRLSDWLVAPLGLLAVAVLLYHRVFLGEWFWPDLAFYAGSLRAGEWPLWNPFDRGGYSWAGDPHPGIYYPFTWLFVVPGALLGDVPGWMMQAKAILHQALGGIFLYAYLRGRDLGRGTAFFGGVLLIASTAMIIHKASALTWPMIWAPLVWLAIDRLAETPDWRRGVFLGAAIGVAGLAGPPPGFFYILVPSLAYGALRFGQLARSPRHALGLGIAALTTVALLLVTVLPQIDAASLSLRADRTIAYSTGGGLERDPTLIGLFAPWAGKVDSYLGILGMLCLGVALLAKPLGDRGGVLFFFLGGVLATLLSFGGNEPYLGFLVEHVPGFGLFRDASRYKVLAAMLFVPAAAHGAGSLVREPKKALPFALGLAAIFLGHALLRPGTGRLTFFLVLSGGVALSSAAAFLGERVRVFLPLALAALSFVDTNVYARPFVVRSERAPDEAAADRRRLEGLADLTREWRVLDEFFLEQRPGSRLRIRDLRGYPAGDPYEDVRYREVLAAIGRHPELVELYNVRYVFHGPHHRIGLGANFLRHPPPFPRLGDRRFEAPHPAPLVAWYGGVVEVARPAEVIPAMVALRQPDGSRQRVVVETPDGAGLPTAEVPLVAGTLVDYRLNRVAFEIDAPAAGLVVLNEKLHRGWEVTVDGEPARPVRANYLLRGVAVGPGKHQVVWRYAPPGYFWLLALWGVAVAAVAAATISFRRR